MAQIAEAYLHLKQFDVSDEALRRYGRDISATAAITASNLFRSDSEIEVRLESGSLKFWVRVIGVIVVGYPMVAEYKDFKEGTVAIVQDAKEFGGIVISEFLKLEHIKPRQIYRAERRTKTPGKLLRVFKRREWLESHRAQLNATEVRRQESAIEAMTEGVLEDLEPDERRIVRKLLQEETPLKDETVNSSDRTPKQPKIEGAEPAALEEKIRQAELFDFGVVSTDDSKSEFYSRFRLSDWLADQTRAASGQHSS